MSNESNQVFSAPGVYYITPQEQLNTDNIVILESNQIDIEARLVVAENNIGTLETQVSTLENNYEENFESSITFSNSGTTFPSAMRAARYKKRVTINFIGGTITTDPSVLAFFISSNPLPVTFRPSTEILSPVSISINNSVIDNTPGTVEISVDGEILVYRDLKRTTKWSSSVSGCGFENITISYTI